VAHPKILAHNHQDTQTLAKEDAGVWQKDSLPKEEDAAVAEGGKPQPNYMW